MVVGENKRASNIMDGIESTGDVRLHDHRLRLKQRFDIVRKLGQGTYGKVQLGINKKTGQEVAIKTIKKCKIETEADLVRIRREVQIMSSVRHPNIVHIYEVFENSEKMILVMEYCSGGELYDYLSQKKVLQEDEARRLFRQIATAVYYCHIHKICHRDLKLENVLLDETGSAKIADFGLSNVFKETSLLSTFCGSPLYASPEIVKGTPYIGPEVDCWSLGVLLYTLVYGAMPFDGSNFKRLVRQISNGDYYEPKSPSTASQLIRDMLTVDPLKRADIAYICDHPWVNTGCEASCLEVAEALAAETPVRLDLLLSLAPAAPSNSNSVVVPNEAELGPEESCTDLTSSTSMAVEPSNSAEKRILELVAEGGEDAIKPSPTRTIVSAGENKRKLELAMSASGLHRKKERVASCASMVPPPAALPEEPSPDSPTDEPLAADEQIVQPTLKSSATITISPSPGSLVVSPTREIVAPKEEVKEKPTAKPNYITKKKSSPPKAANEKSSPDKEEVKEDTKTSSVASAADKLTSLSLGQQAPANQTPAKPKKLSIPGGSVGSFKEQFERRASLTTGPDSKRNLSKPVVSKIAKPKAQSEDRELSTKPADNGTVRLQQIGIEPAQTPTDEPSRNGVKKTESEPTHGSAPVDPSVLLQDARRSLQNSMAKLVEEKAGEENRRRAARDIISSAIRTGKPPMPYGRSSSAGVTSLSSLISPPGTPPAPPATAPPGVIAPKVYRTEAQHKVEDHRNRGVSVERIIPIRVAGEETPTSPPPAKVTPVSPPAPTGPPPLRYKSCLLGCGPNCAHKTYERRRDYEWTELKFALTVVSDVFKSDQVVTMVSCAVSKCEVTTDNNSNKFHSRMVSVESTGSAEGEPIKKSAREFIIPIAVEGKGYVTPRQRSLEPESPAPAPRHRPAMRSRMRPGPMYGSLVSGGESDEEDDAHMHRLRSTRAARAESVSSGEEDEEDEGFHLLTAENLFSTLLHRVRALTQRLNGEEGPGFSQHSHSLFNNLQSPFFNSPHLPRRHHLREGWGTRDLQADLDSMFSKSRQQMPRGNTKKSSKQPTKSQQNTEPKDDTGLDLSDLDLSSIQLSDKEMRALSGLTPALSRRLQQQLLDQLPPAAARSLRRTLSLHNAAPPRDRQYTRSHSATKSTNTDTSLETQLEKSENLLDSTVKTETTKFEDINKIEDNSDAQYVTQPSTSDTKPVMTDNLVKDQIEVSAPQFCTLPRLKRHTALSRESTPTFSANSDVGYDYSPKLGALSKELSHSRGSSIHSTPDRPLLSKYLTPERNTLLDESYSSDSGSILSEPSYIAAYGTPVMGVSGNTFRRHSMRHTGDRDKPKKLISRFLRPDFYETPPDESIYAKHKKEKELETQKILREIREKKNKIESSAIKSPTETDKNHQLFDKDEGAYSCKSLSPISILSGKERSRSITPFYPILDKIKEATLDTSLKASDLCQTLENVDLCKKLTIDEGLCNRESKLIRPKSYPVKNSGIISETHQNQNMVSKLSLDNDNEPDQNSQKESKLVRPKSYPSSSPSPEKIYVNRNVKTEEPKKNILNEDAKNLENMNDVEVSFSISLPRKAKLPASLTANSLTKIDLGEPKDTIANETTKGPSDSSLLLKKYQVLKSASDNDKEQNDFKLEESKDFKQKTPNIGDGKTNDKDNTIKITKDSSQKEMKLRQHSDETLKSEALDKKGTIKKRIIRKVSSKSKTNSECSPEANDAKEPYDSKKNTKKVKEKCLDDPTKTNIVTKKKSMLQSIGHKLEKLASSKSNSPEKTSQSEIKDIPQLVRIQREQSVPTSVEPTSESNLIKRAVTLTDVAALDITHGTSPNKTAVSKVLGLFKKFDSRDKVTTKSATEKSYTEPCETEASSDVTESIAASSDKDKPKRPTSLLLNGLGRKHKYGRTASDSVSLDTTNNDETAIVKKENDSKNLRNSLKLDFSRLPRVKKIVPANPVIEPKVMLTSPTDLISEEKTKPDRNSTILDNVTATDIINEMGRSRSRSRSTFSNSDVKSNHSFDLKMTDKNTTENIVHHPHRNKESTTPEKEDLIDRIRRKSFYTRFNEKKLRRKSSLVGPGATEYDPVARIHSPPNERDNKYDLSPTSSRTYDISPGFSAASDLSPSTERYRSLLNDLPTSSRRYDTNNYCLNDKFDTYRSLDRSDLRKCPGSQKYSDYDHPLSHEAHRYARTKSLLDSSDEIDDRKLLGQQKEQCKYNRTISMYSPGNYATYRPKRIRNSAIIMKDSEKEPSPENILDKIRQRKKLSLTVTRRPEPETEYFSRPSVSSKGEGDGAECSEKTD